MIKNRVAKIFGQFKIFLKGPIPSREEAHHEGDRITVFIYGALEQEKTTLVRVYRLADPHPGRSDFSLPVRMAG